MECCFSVKTWIIRRIRRRRNFWKAVGVIATFGCLLVYGIACFISSNDGSTSNQWYESIDVFQPGPPREHPDTPQGRKDRVSEVCASGYGWTETIPTRSSFVNQRYNFSICRVPDIASTFWIRFLYQMVNTYPMKSPFEVEASVAYEHIRDLHINNAELGIFQKMATRVLFVREPFSRLLSAYVDKLLLPNPTFWKDWGVPAILKFRSGAQRDKVVKICGHDTSFSEFISFAVSTGYTTDNHLRPFYHLCSPCQQTYTVIGKMETFTGDAKYVTSLLGIRDQQIRFEMLKDDRIMEEVHDSTGGSFKDSGLRSALQCISCEAAAQRVWRKLQIRGIISWRQTLRLTEEQKVNLDMQELRNMLYKAQALSTNETELETQRTQAFVEAYKSLNLFQLQDIIKVYANDFKLFGYSTSLVENMFKEFDNFRNTRAFDWSVDWDLSGM